MVKNFLEYIKFEKALSVNTQLSYQRELTKFKTFCDQVPVELLAVGKKEINSYLRYLRTKDLTPRSIAHHISTIKQLFTFLERENLVTSNPVDHIEIPFNRPQRLCLTAKEIKSLIEATHAPKQRAMVEFLYSTGCRVSEMLSLRSSDIDWTSKHAKVLGKGSKERFVLLSDTAIEWMRLIDTQEKEFFFQPFTRQAVFLFIKKIAATTGIKHKVSPHIIRHSFATHFLRNGADLTIVKELLGHVSITSTQIYTHVTLEDVKASHGKFHPRK